MIAIKELGRGELRLTTDSFGIVYVKWVDVERIKSKNTVQVELVDGSRYFGSVQSDKTPGSITLDVAGEQVVLNIDRIIFMQAIKGSKSLRDISTAVSRLALPTRVPAMSCSGTLAPQALLLAVTVLMPTVLQVAVIELPVAAPLI